MANLPDLSSLPMPQAIEAISYEDFLEQLVADIKARFANEGVDWDVDQLETDPAKIIAEAASYRETVLRSRINYVAQQGFLFFAEGGNLDQLAAWLGVARLDGESDERLKERYRLATFGRSAGGPKERYEAIALGADLDVRAVKIWREGRDPTLNFAVLANSGNGEPTNALLEKIEAELKRPENQLVSDRFKVVSAIRRTIDVRFSIRLSPSASETVADTIAAAVQVAWQKQDLLGLDLTQAFLIQAASNPQVTNVEVLEPSSDVVAVDNEAIGIGNVVVEISGRGR